MVLYLKLISSGGEVHLVTCTERGDIMWNILRIRPDGRVERYESVASDIGLRVDVQGKIIIE